MRNTTSKFLAALFLLTLSGTALAHPGHDFSGFTAGVLHPFSGLDHLLAMLTVGLWAATLGGAVMWKMPVAFIVALLCGALLGMNGIHLPMVEPCIALSLLMLGLAVSFSLRVPTTIGLVTISFFAMFHGHAHGAELPEAASSYLYLFGIALSSVALHLTGLGFGRALKGHQWMLRSSGVLIASAGAWLVIGM